MDNKCSLNKLPVNKSGLVYSIECKENLKNRIYDFGIIENSIITPIFNSPFGDPRAYLIKNAIVALRDTDSENIIVSPIEN